MPSNGTGQAEHVPGYDLFALADPRCFRCGGTGEVGCGSAKAEPFQPRGERKRNCDCVYRRAFRSCMRRYYESREFGGLLRGHSTAEVVSKRIGKCPIPRAFRHAEYNADIEITARRALETRPVARAVWWYHFIHRLHFSDCIRLLRRDVGMDLNRGKYFNEVYATEIYLGRVFLELKPYGLYPADYFSNRGWIECTRQSNS